MGGRPGADAGAAPPDGRVRPPEVRVCNPRGAARNPSPRAPPKRKGPASPAGPSLDRRENTYCVFFIGGFAAGGGAEASFGHTTLYVPRLTLSRTWISCFASSCTFIQSPFFLVM